MNKNYRVCFLVSFFMIISVILYAIPIEANNAQIQKHRIVVLVYDDSGSMDYQCNSWEKANYSLQALTGLLDSKDQLLVVRMSTPEQVSNIELGDSRRQSSINGIRNTPNANGSTPFAALQTAANYLGTADQDYERWLVLITDGEIYKNENDTLSTGEFSNFLEEFLNQKDNCKINCIFLAIGNQVPSEFKTAWKISTGQSALEASDASEIIQRMDEISALITSRDPGHAVESPLEVKYISPDTVEISSPFPVRRFTILRQSGADTSLSLQKAQKDSNKPLQITGPFTIGTPVGGTDRVAGRIIHIQDPAAAMPAGKYRLGFAADVSAQQEQIKYLAELAVDFNCGFYKTEGNKLVKIDSTNSFTGEKVQAQVEIIDAGSGEVLDVSQLTGLIEVVMDIDDSPTEILQMDANSNAFVSRAFTLQAGKSNARFTMSITGWYQASKNCVLEITDRPVRNLGLIIEPAEWRGSLDQLDETDPIYIIPTVDGRPMTESEFTEIKDNLQVNTEAKIRVKAAKDHFEIHPELAALGMAFTPAGSLEAEVQLTGRIPGEEVRDGLSIYIEDLPWWIKYRPWIVYPLLFLFALWYINGIVRKPRFARDEAFISHETTSILNGRPSSASNPVTERLAGGWFQRWLVPYRAETLAIAGLTFIAMPNKSCIKISQESLENELDAEGTRIFASGIKVDKEDLASDIILNGGEELLIERRVRRERFKYII